MLSLEAATRLNLVEVSKSFKSLPKSPSLEDLSEHAYNLREKAQYTREMLAEEIGVPETELFDLELNRMQDITRAQEILQLVSSFIQALRK
jgi:hypothetical protein